MGVSIKLSPDRLVDNLRRKVYNLSMANRSSFKTHEQYLEYHRKYRAKNRDKMKLANSRWRLKIGRKHWNKVNPVATQAHRITNVAIQNGFLKRKPCEICGSEKYNRAHHDNYKKPLKVRWFCEKHHRELHKKLLEKNRK